MRPATFKALFAVLAFAGITNTLGQDSEEGATTLKTVEEIPVRQPSSPFTFIKDRTPSLVSKRIIGGDVAEANQYPFQVALYITINGYQYFCGGTLITSEWVMTAAHCADGASSFTILLGAHNLSAVEDNRITVTSTEYVIHENWDSYYIRNDIALIRLPEAVTLSTYINTVPLASGSDSYSGQISRVLGWGLTILGSLSSVLRYVDAEVITNDACNAYDGYTGYIVDQHICAAGNGTVGSCNGDSGGALLVDGVQVGIVSFGVADCSAGWPSVYARLTSFYSWVNSTIENYQQVTDATNEVTEAGETGGGYRNGATVGLVLGTFLWAGAGHFA